MTEDPHPLDLIDRPRVLELLTEHLSSAWSSFDLPRPKEPELDDELHARLEGALPEQPGDPQQALSDAAHVLDASVSPSRPLYAAYIGSTGLEAGVLAGALQHAYDVNLASSAGAAELVEQQALRWMAAFIGFPMSEGVFTSGGMTSNLTALTAARESAIPGSRADGVSGQRCAVYCSDEAHHSVVRAVEVMGIGSSAVRRIPIDAQRRMRPDALGAALDADRGAGVTAVAVVATAGTTLTGAVDPLAEIAGICREHRVWMHVDGAYGGPLAAVPELKHLFTGIARADSITVDAHKLMGVQKSCSLVMLGREGALARAFSHQERYMLHTGAAHNAVDATLEYSRPVRSLKLWLALRIYGAEVMRRWIGQTVVHARALTAAIAADNRFELLHDPMLSTVCFRYLGPDDGAAAESPARGGRAGASPDRPAAEDRGAAAARDLDDLNRRLAAAVTRDGRVYLAAATVDGHTCLRVCFTNFRTRDEHVTELFSVVTEVAAGL